MQKCVFQQEDIQKQQRIIEDLEDVITKLRKVLTVLFNRNINEF